MKYLLLAALITFAAGQTVCYILPNEPVDPLADDCTCYETCSTCGYGPMPSGMDECITCADGGPTSGGGVSPTGFPTGFCGGTTIDNVTYCSVNDQCLDGTYCDMDTALGTCTTCPSSCSDQGLSLTQELSCGNACFGGKASVYECQSETTESACDAVFGCYWVGEGPCDTINQTVTVQITMTGSSNGYCFENYTSDQMNALVQQFLDDVDPNGTYIQNSQVAYTSQADDGTTTLVVTVDTDDAEALDTMLENGVNLDSEQCGNVTSITLSAGDSSQANTTDSSDSSSSTSIIIIVVLLVVFLVAVGFGVCYCKKKREADELLLQSPNPGRGYKPPGQDF